MKTQPTPKKHWGWRIQENFAVFAFSESPSVSNVRELSENLHVVLTGSRDDDNKPHLSIKVTQTPPTNIDVEKQLIYGSLQFRFCVYCIGIILSDVELHNVMEVVTEAVRQRRAKQ